MVYLTLPECVVCSVTAPCVEGTHVKTKEKEGGGKTQRAASARVDLSVLTALTYPIARAFWIEAKWRAQLEAAREV